MNYKEIMVSKGNLSQATEWLMDNGYRVPLFIGRSLHLA